MKWVREAGFDQVLRNRLREGLLNDRKLLMRWRCTDGSAYRWPLCGMFIGMAIWFEGESLLDSGPDGTKLRGARFCVSNGRWGANGFERVVSRRALRA